MKKGAFDYTSGTIVGLIIFALFLIIGIALLWSILHA